MDGTFSVLEQNSFGRHWRIMKRDINGLWRDEFSRPVFDEFVDWSDFGQKMACMMDFAAKGCSATEYRDSFLIYVRGAPATEPKKTIEMCWYSSKFSPNSVSQDPRNHEALLRQFFKDYTLSIEKLSYHWKVCISSPGDETAKHLIKVRRPASPAADVKP